jgi:glycosyltransferase involved in cell wall biosynthesis
MTDETNTSPETEIEQKENQPSMAAAPPPRDIIAERLAQRMKEREATGATEPAKSEEPVEDAPKPERKILDFTPKEAIVEPLQEAESKTPAPIDNILAETTESIETPAPVPTETENRENQRRDRARNRDRNERRPPRESRPERNSESEKTPVLQPRNQQPSRQPRPERQERKELPDRSEKTPRDVKQAQPKTTDNTFSRARSLASKLGVSVVIPLYNEQDSLRELTAALREELFKLCDNNYEIIYINDGSTDRSPEILKDIVAGTSKVSTLTFRNNLGKSSGLSVGFKEARYGIVVTMDADLQDDPKELVNLIAKLDEGFDLVSGWKKKRHDPISKTVPSKLFNSVTSFFSGIKLHDFNCGLKAYRKPVTDSLDVYGEMHRYLPALAHWQGFRVTEIPVLHHPRRFGKSKFGSSRFFKGFLDLLSIVFTNRYGKRPLHLFGTIGTIFALIGLCINIYVTIEWTHGIPLSNRPILLLGILLMMVGVQLISIGLLGEMIVKNSVKGHEIPFIKDKRKPRPSRPGEDRPSRPQRSGDDRPSRPQRPGDERRSRGPRP